MNLENESKQKNAAVYSFAFSFKGVFFMSKNRIFDALDDNPIIAAVKERFLDEALASPANVIFMLGGSILSIEENIKKGLAFMGFWGIIFVQIRKKIYITEEKQQ